MDITRDLLEKLKIKGPHIGVLHSALKVSTATATFTDGLPVQQQQVDFFGPFLLLNNNKTDQGSGTALRVDRVRTLDELHDSVESLVKLPRENLTLLFGGNYNAAKKQTDFVTLRSSQQLGNLVGQPQAQGDTSTGIRTPILLRYGAPGSKTPPSSPEQERTEVPSAVVGGGELFSLPVTFADDVPELYEDAALKSCELLFQNRPWTILPWC